MLSNDRGWKHGIALALLLAGSATVAHSQGGGAAAAVDPPVKTGAPYQVDGVTYTPVDENNYDEVGYAGWYGSGLEGNNTASGEPFNPQAVSAAHKTLPLPSYVEVTAIDTGRTILVRVNDRGPFSNNRLIDLSEGAARQLGLKEGSFAGVRVRRVNPPQHERTALRSGGQAAERLETPPGLLRALSRRLSEIPPPREPMTIAATNPSSIPLTPPSVPKPAPTTPKAKDRAKTPPPGATYPIPGRPAPSAPEPVGPEGGFVVEENGRSSALPRTAPVPATSAAVPGRGWYVQVAAFSSRDRADTAVKRLGAGAGVYPAGSVHRVRLGPYGSEGEARGGLAKAKAQGYSDARIFRE